MKTTKPETKDQKDWLPTDDREWNDLKIYKHRGSYFVKLDDCKKEIAKVREDIKKKVDGMIITSSSINGCSCPNCIKELGTEHYNQAIYDVISSFRDNPFV